MNKNVYFFESSFSDAVHIVQAKKQSIKYLKIS